jgi:predicted ATPase
MLAEVSFENFKSYRQASLPLAPLTLLIGANASGKSNAIEGLRFLSWLAQDHKLSSIRYEVQQSDDILRGRVGDLPSFGSSGFAFTCRGDLRGDAWIHQDDQLRQEEIDQWDLLTLGIELLDDELHVVHEAVKAQRQEATLYTVISSASPSGNEFQVSYNNFKRGQKKPQITCSDQQPVFLQLQTPARFEAGHEKAQRLIPLICGLYRALLAEIVFLDPSPRLMRGYSFKTERILQGDGSNISGVVYHLCEDEHARGHLLELIASLPEQNIKGIAFVETPRGEVMIQLVETFGAHERTVDAPLLSDGTLRVLAVAAALLSAPEGSMVVIEEIDNGVHPTRAHELLRNIREIASERQLRVLLTTHNPALMDALPDEALGDVVFCYRDPAEGDSRLVRLADLERAPSLLAQGSLGDLVTRGVLDRFVKDRPSPEEEEGRRRAWIEELEQIGRQ